MVYNDDNNFYNDSNDSTRDGKLIKLKINETQGCVR